MKKLAYAAIGIPLLVVVAGGAWYWQHVDVDKPASVAAVQAPAPAPVPTAPSPVVPSEPAIRHPIEAPASPASGASPPAATDTESVLTDLFGRKSALGMFQFDDFPRRVVATVDNLGRSHAPSRMWPVKPTDGRFMTEQLGDAEVISADNGLRYTPFVLLIETVDLRQLVVAYKKLYPLFQRAYEELGFPKRYFNDRVVEVLDQLAATPDVNGPIKVHPPTVNGPVRPQRPWLLYEFTDPALHSLTAGQRIVLRTGPVNERRLKSKLAELRRLLATGTPK